MSTLVTLTISTSSTTTVLASGIPRFPAETCTVEWKAWLDWLAKFSRMPSTVLIDLALAEWAKQYGFTEPPPKRQTS